MSIDLKTKLASRPESVASVDLLPSLHAAAHTGGYAWWYTEIHDASQERFGLTLIMFAGSVFSPAYAAQLRHGTPLRGLDVPAINLVLHESTGQGRARKVSQRAWVMNEYPASALRTEDRAIHIAQSSLEYLGDGSIRIFIDEDTTRFFGRPGPKVRGHLRVRPNLPVGKPLLLAENPRGEAHFWQPIAACAPAEVDLQVGEVPLRYEGTAYCDRNFGEGRLEDSFRRWCWAHGFSGSDVAPAIATPSDSAVIVYDTTASSGNRQRIALHYPGGGQTPALQLSHGRAETPLPGDLPPDGKEFLWLKVPRSFVAGDFRCERLPRGNLLDSPFYARFRSQIQHSTQPALRFTGVGEYLDLERFSRPALQHLLRYKTRQVVP